jgi:CDP-paratose 2-epimerase
MKVLIIGGAGFIGSNAAKHFLNKGDNVTIFDNFSRAGGKNNIEWLQTTTKKPPQVIEGDIRRDTNLLQEAVKNTSLILHLAGQVAVTTSVQNPREDFDINALGTFNVLEAVRISGNNPVFIFSSTNKVYGALEKANIQEKDTRYVFGNLPNGVDEDTLLDFHSPYGCSKGAADQYVRDYHRIYGLNTIVFRQSCIYGPRQFGIEDQGWLAWFIIALTLGQKITIYGNGKQVRDILYVKDLVEAYDLAAQNIDKTKGQIYNIGGGINQSLSIWYEFKPILEKLFNKSITASFADTRPGDQSIYISQIEKARRDFLWQPHTDVESGIRKLYEWVVANQDLFKSSFI